MTGFDSTTSDLTIAGGSSAWSAGASSGSGHGPYTFTVSRGSPNTDGTLTIKVAASAAQDAATNSSTASNTVSYTIDTAAPTVSLTKVNGNAVIFPLSTNTNVTTTQAVNQAGSTTTVDCSGTPFTYNGNTHGCTASWASNSTDAGARHGDPDHLHRPQRHHHGPSPTTAPTHVGYYTASVSLRRQRRPCRQLKHRPATNFAINQAVGSTPTTVDCSGTPFTYNGNTHGCTASWASNSTDAEHGTGDP